jgi:uncharacterized protein with GYD domain
MGYYLIQVSYTPEGSAALIKKPQNREEAVRKFIEKLGGSLEGFWFAFGDYDVVLIVGYLTASLQQPFPRRSRQQVRLRPLRLRPL